MDYNTSDHDDMVFDDPDTAYTPVNEAQASKGESMSEDFQRKILDEMRKADSNDTNGEMKSPWESSEQQIVQGTKNKTLAGLLGVFLGAFGIHNFYIGKTGRGVAQLLISVLSGGTLVFIPELWGLIEGILILSSKRGSKWHKDGQGKEFVD